jgi:hypothetical protein
MMQYVQCTASGVHPAYYDKLKEAAELLQAEGAA